MRDLASNLPEDIVLLITTFARIEDVLALKQASLVIQFNSVFLSADRLFVIRHAGICTLPLTQIIYGINFSQEKSSLSGYLLHTTYETSELPICRPRVCVLCIFGLIGQRKILGYMESTKQSPVRMSAPLMN